jgi:hypothetical protein
MGEKAKRSSQIVACGGEFVGISGGALGVGGDGDHTFLLELA